MQSKSMKLALLCAAIIGASSAQAAPPQRPELPSAGVSVNLYGQALAAAQRDLAQLGKRSAPQGELPFGLSSSDLGAARVAYGFPVHTVDPAAMLAGQEPLSTLAKPNGQWRFVVAVRGKPVGLVTVESVNGQFEAVAYGAAELSRDIDALFARHGNPARSNLRFVRVHQSGSDLLEVAGTDGRLRFAPLQSARAALALQKDELLDESVLAAPLRAAARANIEAFR
jgi:hypothetical protein